MRKTLTSRVFVDRRWRLIAALGIIGAQSARGQVGVIAGTVRNAADGGDVPFTVVTLTSARREVLANQVGRFALRDVSVGQIEMRFRRVGFVPLDTVVTVTAGDTTRIHILLAPLSMRLPAMQVVGSSHTRLARGCAAFPTENARAVVLSLLDQFAQNAEQYRALVRAHPFWLQFTWAKVTRNVDGKIVNELPNDPRLGPVDHLVLVASERAVYQPGKVFRVVRGVDEVFVPELQDFADEGFMMNHCFAYAGDTTVDSTPLVRLQFAPAPAVTEPDIKGTAYLRAKDYALTSVEMRTTGLAGRFAKQYDSVRIQLRYRDLYPGIVVLSHLESFLLPSVDERRRFPMLVSRGEVEDFAGVRWLKSAP